MKAEPEVFLDTNVLLYAVSSAPEEAVEYGVAWQVIEENNWGTSVQVLQEFYVNVTGKLRNRVHPQVAAPLMDALLTRPMATTTPDLFTRAVDISRRYRISYWDAAIVAAAANLGCSTLLTQDLNSGQTYEGVTAIDPF